MWARAPRSGANAVVVDDVPAGATVVGAPARPTANACDVSLLAFRPMIFRTREKL